MNYRKFISLLVFIAITFAHCCPPESRTLTNLFVEEMALGNNFVIGVPFTVSITIKEDLILDPPCGDPSTPAGWTQTRFFAEWQPEGGTEWEIYPFTTEFGKVQELFIETPPSNECNSLSFISVEITVDDPGSYRFFAIADGNESIEERNEGDNDFLLDGF